MGSREGAGEGRKAGKQQRNANGGREQQGGTVSCGRMTEEEDEEEGLV
jgi:hypothetical protein